MFIATKKVRSLLSIPAFTSGIDAVATDATLSGDGTVGAPLSVVGGGGITIVTTTATAFSPGATDDIIKADSTSNNIVINLPAAAVVRQIVIKKMASANVVTLDPSGAELIDGLSTEDLLSLNEVTTIVSDGTGWLII